MKDSFMILIGIVGLIAVLSLVSEGIKMARAEAEKEENETKRFVFNHVLDLADTIVKSLNQTVVSPLKDSPELRFDKEAQKRVLKTAEDKIKSILDDKSKELLGEYLGTDKKVDDFIKDAIEAKVSEAKSK